MSASAADVVAELHARGVVLPAGNVRVDCYGDSPELSRLLLAMIRSGRKRAGTGLLWWHEHESAPFAQAGDIEIVLTHDHQPSIVTRITRVEVLPYGDVSAEYAAIEGEGDGSLGYWRAAHLELPQPRPRIDRQGAHGRDAARPMRTRLFRPEVEQVRSRRARR